MKHNIVLFIYISIVLSPSLGLPLYFICQVEEKSEKCTRPTSQYKSKTINIREQQQQQQNCSIHACKDGDPCELDTTGHY